jgi:hypothetical protein
MASKTNIKTNIKQGCIVYYPANSTYEEKDILLIDAADEQVVGLFTAEKKPFKCYSASKENLTNFGAFLQSYLKYKYGFDLKKEELSKAGEVYLFFQLWEELIDCFNSGTPRSIVPLLARVRAMQIGFFGGINTALNLIEEFTTHVIVRLLEGTPYYERDVTSKPRRWTPNGVNWLQSLRTLAGSLATAKRNLIGKTSGTVEDLHQFTRNNIRFWESYEKKPGDEKCCDMSSYTYSLARMHRARGQFSLSLLFLHRALDFYLQYIALRLGPTVLAERSDGRGWGYTGSDSGLEVNPLRTFTKLEASNSYAGLHSFTATVRDVNESRNKLLMTHYVYGIDEAASQSFITGFETIVNRIEVNDRLLRARSTWEPLPRIDPFFVFELEGSMDVFLAEVKI